jgi:hypothetical protein
MPANRKYGNGPVAIDVGVSARASVEARVSTEIPAQSTGRLVDAITDVFRPFSERRGLKADMIRLQREEVLLEIARRARARLQAEGREPSPLPNKFLIPFLEKASLEEAGGGLVERWADLLASSSAEPASAHPRFVQVLSEITVGEAELLRKIAFHCIDEVRAPNQAFTDCPHWFEPKDIKENLQKWLRNAAADVDAIYSHIIGMFEMPGVFLLDITVIRATVEKIRTCGRLNLQSRRPFGQRMT